MRKGRLSKAETRFITENANTLSVEAIAEELSRDPKSIESFIKRKLKLGLSEEEEVEIRANKSGLSYVKLDGNIGCLVNGAGLAMASMDVIKLYGGEPANFLDIGGGANKESITTAFGIILEDPNVEGILVNIFGGIIRCDMVARSIIDASREVGLSVPLVVRLAGTNFKEGKEILDNSGLKLISAENLDDAAKKIVEAIK